MLDIIDTPDQTPLLVPEFPAAPPDHHDDLGDAITSLWNAHQASKKTIRATNEELRTLRAQLGAQLSSMKQLLAKPGRAGQWSSFLLERQIPRATADRLVARYQHSLNPELNSPTEAISEPTEQEMREYFNSVLPRLKRFLKTSSTVYSFVEILANYFGCGEIVDGGILVRKPDASAICPLT